MTRCHSWLLIPWCLMTTGHDQFASAVPAAAAEIRDSILSPVGVGGGRWNERCKRAAWDPNAVPMHLRILCRQLGEGALLSSVDQLEKALGEAEIRSSLSPREGASDEVGTKYLREEGSPLKLLEKIRGFTEEEEEKEEGETGEKSNGGGEKNVSEDGDETRSLLSHAVKRETSSQKLRGSISALARYLKSRRGFARETRNKDTPGNRSTNGPRMSLYFLG